MVDDPDAVGEYVRLLEVLRRQEHRHALGLREPADLRPKGAAALRVQPRRRLVEEEDSRPVDERESEVEAPLHPAGVRLHLAIGRAREPDADEQLFASLVAFPLRQAVEAALEPQMLAAREVRVERRLLQRRADRPAHPRTLMQDVVPGHPRGAGGRRQQRGEHQHSRRLARSVRPEEPVDLARLDLQLDPVDRARALLELAHEPLDLDPG